MSAVLDHVLCLVVHGCPDVLLVSKALQNALKWELDEQIGRKMGVFAWFKLEISSSIGQEK